MIYISNMVHVLTVKRIKMTKFTEIKIKDNEILGFKSQLDIKLNIKDWHILLLQNNNRNINRLIKNNNGCIYIYYKYT